MMRTVLMAGTLFTGGHLSMSSLETVSSMLPHGRRIPRLDGGEF